MRFKLNSYSDVDIPTPVIDTLSAESFVRIEGNIKQNGSALDIVYKISGDRSNVCWPLINDGPQRKDLLWEHTCFELFLAVPGDPRYCEYNFSPSHDWNAFQFADYRLDKQNLSVGTPHMQTDQNPGGKLILTVSLHLSSEYNNKRIDAGISAVIEDKQGAHHYFALTHCCEKPDFHSRESFIIRLGI